MKKRILALAMTLTMMLSIAACGSKPVDRNDSDNRTDDTKTEESLEETTSQDEEEGSALADWYNSDDRKTLEDTISGMFESQGLTFFVEIEEPDTIIYNYKYTEQLDLEGLTQDDINANFDASMDDVAATVISDIGRYQSTYGIPLTTIRVIPWFTPKILRKTMSPLQHLTKVLLPQLLMTVCRHGWIPKRRQWLFRNLMMCLLHPA